MATRETKIKVTGDSSKYERTMRDVKRTTGKTTQDIKSKFKSAATSIGGMLGAITLGYGIKKVSGAFVDAASTAEQFQIRLTGLLGSSEEGKRLFEDMAIYAGKVPFEYRKVMDAATQLAGIMQGGVDEIKQWMPLIGDLAAATGLGIEKTTEQVVRMYSAGAASADLFREKGTLAMLGFQAGVSYSAEETRQQLMRAWKDPESKFKGMTKELAKSWGGLVTILRDSWFKFQIVIMEAGVFDELKKTLKGINTQFERWIKNNKELIAQKVPEYIDRIKTSITGIHNIYEKLPEGTVGAAGYGLIGGILFGGKVGAVIAGLFLANKQLEKMPSGLKKWMDVATGATPATGILGEDWDVSIGRRKRPKDKLPTETWTQGTGMDPNLMKYDLGLIEMEMRNFQLQGEASWADYQQRLGQGEAEHLEFMKELKDRAFQDDISRAAEAMGQLDMILQQQANREIQIEKYKQNSKMQMAENWLSFTITIGNALQAISGSQSKTLFYMSRAAGVAQATVSAFQAYGLALANPPGPPWTIPLAKTVLALGLANAAALGAVAIGQGPGGGGGGAVGTYPASPYTGAPELPGMGAEEEKKPTVNIHIYGDYWGDPAVAARMAEILTDGVENYEVNLVASGTKE